jgi:hypothetical protein
MATRERTDIRTRVRKRDGPPLQDARPVSHDAGASAWAEAQVAAVRDDPAAPCAARADLPRAHGPRAETPAIPTGGVLVHAVAGAPRCARSARRVAPGQPVVAGDQRAPAAGRVRSGRTRRGPARRAVVAGRTALAGVYRAADGAQLVPRAQRKHRGRLPAAPEAR